MARMYPVNFIWREMHDAATGELRMVMVPEPKYANLARRQFHPGETYPLVVLEPRSRASHSHFFAALHDAYVNLPETISARWQNQEHFRKYLLIETGWFDEEEFRFDSALYAKRFATFYRKEKGADYVRIIIPKSSPTTVIIQTAKSQSAAAMGKKDFTDSKRDVLDLAASFVGTTAAELHKQAGLSP